MRYSRLPVKKPKRNYGTVILFVLLIAVGVYIFTATAAGNWLADNVVTPVFSYLQTGAIKTTGINDLPGASAKPSQSAAASSPGSTVTKSMDADSQTYYLLQSGIFENEQNATDSANALKARGGAGYILKDGNRNRVIMAAFKTESQAKSVKDTLLKNENISTYVYNIKMDGLNFSITAANGQAEALKEGFALPGYCADTLMELSQKYDKNENIDQAIQDLKKKCNATRDNLNSSIKNDEKNEAILRLKEFTGLLCENVNKIPDTLSQSNIELSSQLKYTVIWVAVNYSDFMKKLV